MDRYIFFILAASFITACSERNKNTNALPVNQASVDTAIPNRAGKGMPEKIYPPTNLGIKKCKFFYETGILEATDKIIFQFICSTWL
jgi:hypothetical protein